MTNKNRFDVGIIKNGRAITKMEDKRVTKILSSHFIVTTIAPILRFLENTVELKCDYANNQM